MAIVHNVPKPAETVDPNARRTFSQTGSKTVLETTSTEKVLNTESAELVPGIIGCTTTKSSLLQKHQSEIVERGRMFGHDSTTLERVQERRLVSQTSVSCGGSEPVVVSEAIEISQVQSRELMQNSAEALAARAKRAGQVSMGLQVAEAIAPGGRIIGAATDVVSAVVNIARRNPGAPSLQEQASSGVARLTSRKKAVPNLEVEEARLRHDALAEKEAAQAKPPSVE